MESIMTIDSPTHLIDINELVSLLPAYPAPKTLFIGDKLPCHQANIKQVSTETVLALLQRQTWSEGLYVRKKELHNIIRYQHADGSYKNDFSDTQFIHWVKAIEENTAICEMENNVGKGIFVIPGKTLPKGTFIPSSGIINLNFTTEDLETKVHCSALQNLNIRDRKIYGLINPELKGGILNLINHAPNQHELDNFHFKKSSIKNNVAVANLKSTIKFYNGYAIMGVETICDLPGNTHGTQLLWSYAHSCEYVENFHSLLTPKIILLFNGKDEQNGEIINPSNYTLREIDIFIDTGELILRKVASMTRWEIMENSPESGLTLSIEDPFSSNQSDEIQSPIPYVFLQTYLNKNPLANRIIIKVPTDKD